MSDMYVISVAIKTQSAEILSPNAGQVPGFSAPSWWKTGAVDPSEFTQKVPKKKQKNMSILNDTTKKQKYIIFNDGNLPKKKV